MDCATLHRSLCISLTSLPKSVIKPFQAGYFPLDRHTSFDLRDVNECNSSQRGTARACRSGACAFLTSHTRAAVGADHLASPDRFAACAARSDSACRLVRKYSQWCCTELSIAEHCQRRERFVERPDLWPVPEQCL